MMYGFTPTTKQIADRTLCCYTCAFHSCCSSCFPAFAAPAVFAAFNDVTDHVALVAHAVLPPPATPAKSAIPAAMYLCYHIFKTSPNLLMFEGT